MLDSKVLTLLEVVETGNYTRAAKKLNLTQPAVSQHIRALEEEWNVKFFERSGNRFIVTREGQKILDCYRTMYSLYNNLKIELEDHANGTQSYKIGITHTVESNRLSEVFAKYATNNPGTTIKLITDTQQNLKDHLKKFEIDFAIVDGKVTDPTLASMQIDSDYLMLIVSPTHRLARQTVVTISDIKQEPLLLRLPNSGTRNLFVASLESQNISIDEFNVILEVDNIATIKDLIRSGYGVSVLPESACKSEIRKKQLVALPIENLRMNREINVVYAKGFKHTDIFKELIRMYHEM